MKISAFIDALEQLKAAHGDLEVVYHLWEVSAFRSLAPRLSTERDLLNMKDMDPIMWRSPGDPPEHLFVVAEEEEE